MRKFIILYKKEGTSIMEVECEILSALEDSSVSWMNSDEYRVRIIAPTIFHQKVERVVNGKKESILIPDVWCWHSFYDTVEQAKEVVAKNIRFAMQTFAQSKRRSIATEEEVQKAISLVDVVML